MDILNVLNNCSFIHLYKPKQEIHDEQAPKHDFINNN